MNLSQTTSAPATGLAAPDARAAIHSELLEATFRELKALDVEIPNPDEVAEFLAPFPDFIPRLPEICRLVGEVVDTETSLSLGVWTSIEEGDSMLTLWLHRPTPQPGFRDLLDVKLDAHYQWLLESDVSFNINLAIPRRSNDVVSL
jgi:hypothetical protein